MAYRDIEKRKAKVRERYRRDVASGKRASIQKVLNERARRWRAANPDRAAEHCRRVRKKNPEIAVRASRKYKEANADKINAMARARYAQNPSPIREYHARWCDQHPEYKARQHARLLIRRAGLCPDDFPTLVEAEAARLLVRKAIRGLKATGPETTQTT